MDVNALRTWGIGVGSALMAGAILLSAPQAPPARAEAPQQVVQVQAQTPAPMAFLVRFQGGGPIARAQARAARGQMAQAQRSVELQLARQSAFAGLCFDRFTAGAAEIVLRTCDAIAANEQGAVQQRWLERLRAMRAVAYADANATASPGRAG